MFRVEGTAQAVTPLHFGLLFAHAHCAVRAIGKFVLLKGRTAGADALHHRVLIKWNFHGIRLQVVNVRRLLMPFFTSSTWQRVYARDRWSPVQLPMKLANVK